MKYFLLLAALPVAGVIYLKATKQSLSFEGGKPTFEKDSAKAAKKAVNDLAKAAGVVAQATVVPGGKLAIAKKIISSAAGDAIKGPDEEAPQEPKGE